MNVVLSRPTKYAKALLGCFFCFLIGNLFQRCWSCKQMFPCCVFGVVCFLVPYSSALWASFLLGFWKASFSSLPGLCRAQGSCLHVFAKKKNKMIG